MSLKSIFKILIGTMLLMVITFMVIEYYNISVASPQLKTMTQVALRQSCQYFSQETYKTGSGNAYQIVGKNGVLDTSLNGNFYSSNAASTYKRLYADSYEFEQFINKNRNYWRKLNILGYGLGMGGSINGGEDILADYYVDGMLTPLNIGIAYVDKSTVQKIFKWELVNILMNGEEDMLIIEDEEEPYVFYKGFRIYYNSIKVTDVEYKTYDILNKGEANEFEELTSMNMTEYLKKYNIDIDDERRYITVATLDYSMRVGYEGITPMKRVMTWVFDLEADRGADKTDITNNAPPRSEESWTDTINEDTSLSKAGTRNEDNVKSTVDNYTNSGGYGIGNTIIYYIVR